MELFIHIGWYTSLIKKMIKRSRTKHEKEKKRKRKKRERGKDRGSFCNTTSVTKYHSGRQSSSTYGATWGARTVGSSWGAYCSGEGRSTHLLSILLLLLAYACF